MKRDDAAQLAENALEDLAAALEAGQSDTLKQYLTTMGHFHGYSLRNVILITLQKPDATQVAGFTAWKKLGRYVKKGEKGIGILAPLVYKSQPESESSAPNEDSTDAATKQLRGFKLVHVFDVSQTEGDPLPEFATVSGDPGEHLARLEALVASHGITLEYDSLPAGALGVSRGGAIAVRPDLEVATQFAVLVHELSHELLHRDERRQQTTQTIRETEAEAVSFVVCQAIGLETGTASSDYIQLYQGSTETLQRSLQHIQLAATEILKELLPKSC